MNEIAYLHALVAQKRDGSVLYIAGDIGKDPALIGGYISAFYSMDTEFKVYGTNERKIKSQYYQIGDVLLIVVGKDDLTIYTIFDQVITDLIDDLVEFTKKILLIFEKYVWNKMNEGEKEMGVIPEDLVRDFEKEFYSLCISTPWRKFISFSPLFLRSESAIGLALFMLYRFTKKIVSSLGPSGFWLLIESMIKQYRIKPILRKILRENVKDKYDSSINIKYLKKVNLQDFVITILSIMYNASIKLREVMGKNILLEFDTLRGIKNVPLPKSLTN